jgi:hypothetical protein
MGASSGTEASIHRARALGPQPQRSRTRRRCVRPAPRALARHRDRLRRQRGRATDCPIESLRTLPPCASCAPPARRWHWRHEHATSTPRARHEQHTARVALATGCRSASAWAKIAFMYASSAYARSSGSTVEWTLISPRPLCLKPASPRPLARTMFKPARLGAEAPNSSSASTFQTVSSSSGGPSRSAAVAFALAPADAAQAKACCRPRDTFSRFPQRVPHSSRIKRTFRINLGENPPQRGVLVSFNHLNKRTNS